MYRSGYVNFAANSSDRLLLVQILTVKALFQLSTDTLCKNRSKQVMYVLELFSSNILIYDSFPLCRNSIRKDLSHIAHKRRNARFNGLWWVNTPPQPLNAHTAAHRASGAGN